MTRAFTSLERVLQLESNQGFQNKAVVGGIRQFAAFWVSQAREEAVDEADRAFVEQTAELLMDYGRLPGVEARAEAVRNLLTRLQARQERLRVTQPPPPPPPVIKAKGPARPLPATRPEKPAPLKAPEPEPETALPPDPEGLRRPVTTLKGVGPKISQHLERLGAGTIWELLYIFPRRHDDYSLLKPINRLQYGEQVTIIGTVWESRARRARDHSLVQCVVTDGTGKIQATWFNQPWLVDKLKAGTQIVLSGTVDQFLGRPVFQNPEWEPLELEPLRTRRIVPIYPLTKGLNAHKMRDIMRATLDEWAGRVPDPLPAAIRGRRSFYSLPAAIRQAHFPDSQEALQRARRRLIFDELFLLQLGMLGYRRNWQSAPGVPVPADEAVLEQFTASLPFELTGAQKRVMAEIVADMARDVPMNRLLQGDVGAGKTVVAAAAMVIAARAGLQVAMMAPTEILAEQHYKGLSRMLEGLDISLCLLMGSTPAAEKERLYAGLAGGTIQVAIGTHALIQEAIRFQKLGLAIIDEQHRFGVDQRKALRDKGIAANNGVENGAGEQPNPHLLVMSATPIPRTLALSLYGDLDLSILDEMPPGRQEIKTRWLRPSERERAYAFVRGQVEQGRQAFIICPLVEESDKIDARAAVAEYERLQKEIFPDLKLGLIHGRLKADEKEAVMRAFYERETDILVATSVIEVGIDVPNSTVMVIEGADRFGLAQLHQFRGRVGRGEHQSYCLLLADTVSTEAEERLSALEQTNDGFLLAEKDLEIRGPGEFFGRRQSGLPELQLASLMDMQMLQLARQEAQALFEVDPTLERPEHRLLQEKVAEFWQEAGDVS
ncbi:MAG: ATP-dependent DNA helicase RecG [Chloroflexi bacterium]|nr:ATP-dependent DNA helicase RecG [Chloroflexota bacterium]MCI0574756.1 ATP-dependent DNA helicase RecG [Chloroflexota bacterium]